ncbi:MAG: hypothetical protein HY291_01125 [Planctomycetes bacterium]|nr:hypothetical protein [Planctomycetota bacterium]
MALPVACVCGHEWPDLRGFEGQVVKCPECGNSVRVPGKASEPGAAGQTEPVEEPASRLQNEKSEPLKRFTKTQAAQPRVSGPARPTWLGTAPATKGAGKQEETGPILKSLQAAGGSHVFSVKFREELLPLAEALLQLVVSHAYEQPEYPADFKLPFGWAPLTLRGRGKERAICIPDFSRNPFDDVQEDVSIALSVAAGQDDVVKRAGVKKPMPCLFTDEVVLGHGCLAGKLIEMERKDFPARGFSGWHIMPGDPADLKRIEEKKKIERTPTYRILGRRDILLSLLSLPVGYTARVNDYGIAAVYNANRESVWKTESV